MINLTHLWNILMAKHFISVCIFCLICATHSPCASHAEIADTNIRPPETYNASNKPATFEKFETAYNREKPKHERPEEKQLLSILRTKKSVHNLRKRFSDKTNKTVNDLIDNNNNSNFDNSNNSEQKDYLYKLFSMYGDGDSMTIGGFERLLNHLELARELKNQAGEVAPDRNDSEVRQENESTLCVEKNEILSTVADYSSTSVVNSLSKINDTVFQKACPALIYRMVVGSCSDKEYLMHIREHLPEKSTKLIWICSMGAVILISACGMLAVVIIPIMKKRYYKPILQYLIALAVGTLAGDALLHLLPHAMSSGHGRHGHGHGHEHGSGEFDDNTFKGFVAMMGLSFLFIMERFISLVSKWKKGQRRNKDNISIGSDTNKSSDTQCMDKYNPTPNCYKDIINDQNTTYLEADKTATTTLNDIGSSSDLNSFTKSPSDKLEANQNSTDCPNDCNHITCTEMNKMLPDEPKVALREHEADHHGHSHKHGHAYIAPRTLSAVAWMVIMGDGLHNFTDGMAIGAAFAGSIKGGLSTTVAVFCHELPHELGDFAMLLKAGMTIKQAMFYNLLSSVLCLLGNILGVWLGNTESASSWIFALAAGMFIYIALVDMIPELSSAHKNEGDLTQFILHLTGLFTGIAIMTLIALYEKDLKSIFNE